MRTGCWVGMFLACAITVTAQSVPYIFNYQGVLRGGSGEILGTVSKTVDFRLYDSPANGTLLWGRTYTVFLDTNGLFNVELSDSGVPLSTTPLVLTPKPLSAVIASGSALYLGLKVTGAAEIAPRQQLLSVPFAMMAGDVQSASAGFAVTGVLTAEGIDASGVIQAAKSLQVGDTGTGVATLTASNSGLRVSGDLTVPSPHVIAGFGTIPIGGIIMWSGAQNKIPDGWVLCNGASGTPNLCDRFIVGAGLNYTVGLTGGNENVTLATAQIPAHQHDFHDGYYIESSGSASSYNKLLGGLDPLGSNVTGSQGTDDDNNRIYWRSATTENNANGGGAHENRPPYFALCYIMRVK